MRGIIIAGTHSGCGKTTVTLGILAALRKKGLTVQPFKTGPDFIDTGLHKVVTGRASRNLDLWMCGEDYVKDCYQRYSTDADISVVEGVMGLYDGKLSTASLANTLNLPIVLVVDAYGMAESAGAVVRGFTKYSNKLQVTSCKIKNKKNSEDLSLVTCHSSLDWRGVIFNRVASEYHFNRLKAAVHDIPVLGYLPRDLDFEIPHRHLGLTVAEEEPVTAENMDKLADTVLKYVDMKKIIEGIRCKGQGTRDKVQGKFKRLASCHLPLAPVVRIAVAYDKAFCFYYEDNLDLLRDAGAEIITFSPLTDRELPDNVAAIFIGGGYPELYAEQLSSNKSMLRSVRNWAHDEKPVYAECGGFMYLMEGIQNMESGKTKMRKMAGVFPFKAEMKNKRASLGYREITLKKDCILGNKGSKIRGHEFHYSEIKDSSKLQVTSNKLINSNLLQIYSVKDSHGNHLRNEGYKIKNTFGSYIHIHFGSNKIMAENFINYCKGASWK